jgi:hypothetical protein
MRAFKMTNCHKITAKANWHVSDRCDIVGATYRQALSYLVSLRVRNNCKTYDKPVFIAFD